MLAMQGDGPFVHDDWLFEPKLDGYRTLAWVHDGAVRLMTRGELDLAPAFPHVVAALKSQAVRSLVLDAEIVAFDKDGKPSFSALQTRSRRTRASRDDAILYCFDVLHIEGINTRVVPLDERRRVLENVLKVSPQVQVVHAATDGLALFDAAAGMGMEGLVAKKRSAPYTAGARSKDWLKILAFKRADMLILGYTGSSKVESLLVGYRRGGRLKYAGQVTGLGKLAVTLLPVLKAVPDAVALESIDASRWIAPMLVAEIRYRELTSDGKLRHPVFYRLRDEIAPGDGDFPAILLP